MLRRVLVNSYKSFANTQVSLKQINVVVGPNSSGKSNLLDLLRFISHLANETLSEAFEAQRGDPLEALRKNTEQDEWGRFSLEIDIELSEEVMTEVENKIKKQREGARERDLRRVVERRLRYAVEVELNKNSGVKRIRSEKLVAMRNDWTLKKRPAFIEAQSNRTIKLRREGQAAPPRVYSYLDRSVMCAEPLHMPFYPHITAFKEELKRWRFYYFEPSVMRQECPKIEQKVINENGGGLAAFFWTLKNQRPDDFSAAVSQIRIIIPVVQDMKVEATKQDRLLLWIQQDGKWFTARVVSEGTLRTLGLVAIMHSLEQPTLVGYEEPENGVHPRRISVISDMFHNASSYGLQFIINTHSVLFAGKFPDENILVCRYESGRTRFDGFVHPGSLYRESELGKALEEAILRGDYGG